MLQAAECVYCQEPKWVKEWAETEELVCLDCRQSLLQQEFDQPRPHSGLKDAPVDKAVSMPKDTR